MRIVHLIFILLISQLLMDCNGKQDSNHPKITTSNIVSIVESDDVSPPPPGLISKFKTLQEWLFNICDVEKPKVPINTYDFGFIESEGNYTLYLVGLNDYEIGENHSAIQIDFEPSDMYFPLPKSEYENLDWYEVMAKVEAQLRDFIKTEKFKTSFFLQANLIKTSMGNEIWAK
jgi:hypothetical protein